MSSLTTKMYRKSFGHIHACVQSSLGPTDVRSPDIGQLVKAISYLSAKLNEALNNCTNAKKLIADYAVKVSMGDRGAWAIETLREKHELGGYMLSAAVDAVKSNKTLDGKSLDELEIQTLLDEIGDASVDIDKAAISLKGGGSQS